MMTNEQVYSLAVEKLLNVQIPERAKWIRGNENCIKIEKTQILFYIIKFRSLFLYAWFVYSGLHSLYFTLDT